MIKGSKINLRLIRDEAECHIMADALNDLSERGDGDHTELKSPAQILKRFQEDNFWGEQSGKLLITTKNDDIVGSIGFQQITKFELAIGYRLYHHQNRQQGIMSEALPLFSAYLFATKPIQRLRLQIAADNVGSRRLAKKCSFTQEGILRQAYFYRGRFVDFVIYGMLRSECLNFADWQSNWFRLCQQYFVWHNIIVMGV